MAFVFVCMSMTLCACRPEDSFGGHFIGIVYFYYSLACSWASWPASPRENTCFCLPRDRGYKGALPFLCFHMDSEKNECMAGICWLSYLLRVALVILRYKALFFLRWEPSLWISFDNTSNSTFWVSLPCPYIHCPFWAMMKSTPSSLLGVWGSPLRLPLFEISCHYDSLYCGDPIASFLLELRAD